MKDETVLYNVLRVHIVVRNSRIRWSGSTHQSGQRCTKLLNDIACCGISTTMSVQHVKLADVCSSRKRVFVDTEATAGVSGTLS